MAEREIYNPDTGGFELPYDPGIYGNAPVSDGFEDALNALYQQYYGRNATPEEVAAHRGNPGGLPAIEEMLRGSIPQRETPSIDDVPQGGRPPGPTGPSGPTGPGGGGGGWGYLTEPFTGTPPAWKQGPIYTAPKWTPPPAFSYKEFQAPTPDSIYADPSYKFRFGQGQKALEQSAAGRGVLRTGGTFRDLTDYGQQAASQEYSNIFKRAVDAHNLGLQQALGTYGINYGVSKDQRDYLYDTSRAEFEPLQRENELMNEREFANFLAGFDIFEKNRRRAGDYLTWAASQGAQ